MMAGAIVTSRLLMDLEDVATREDLVPHDPWGSSPDYPDGTAAIVVLRIDGRVERRHVDDVVDWGTIAGFRFEDALGLALNGFDPDGDYEPW